MELTEDMSNLTLVSELLLLEFSQIQELQILHFSGFLAIYLTAVTGNSLIVIAIALDHRLHTPMYLFLMNLAIMDIGSISVIVPKSMANSLMNSQTISYSGCVAQVFFFVFFAGSDFALLTIMAHDRHVAICNPLRYETIMHKGACIQMAGSAWITGMFFATMHTGGTFANTFCSNIVNQFFCEVPKLLKLSCSDLYLIEVGFLVIGCSLLLACSVFIILTYMQIFAAVFKIPSVQGQKKALSTCFPHITVFSLYVFTGLFTYTRPSTGSFSNLDIVFAVIYVIIPPMLNPFIYSMRNKELKTALWKLFNVGHSSKRHCGGFVL